MGYAEALEDKIPIRERPGYYPNIYLPPCSICGRRVRSLTYKRGIKYYCPICRTIVKKSKKCAE